MGRKTTKSWISNQRQEWEFSHKRKICVTDLELLSQRERSEHEGIDEVRVAMLLMADRVGVRWTRRLLKYLRETVEDSRGLIVPVWIRKGDVHESGKHRGITLLSHVMKVLERILDGRVRRVEECEMGEEQQSFRRGKGKVDGMFNLRQLVDKRLERYENMALGCIDFEKAHNTLPKEMATLRWMGLPESLEKTGMI